MMTTMMMMMRVLLLSAVGGAASDDTTLATMKEQGVVAKKTTMSLGTRFDVSGVERLGKKVRREMAGKQRRLDYAPDATPPAYKDEENIFAAYSSWAEVDFARDFTCDEVSTGLARCMNGVPDDGFHDADADADAEADDDLFMTEVICPALKRDPGLCGEFYASLVGEVYDESPTCIHPWTARSDCFFTEKCGAEVQCDSASVVDARTALLTGPTPEYGDGPMIRAACAEPFNTITDCLAANGLLNDQRRLDDDEDGDDSGHELICLFMKATDCSFDVAFMVEHTDPDQLCVAEYAEWATCRFQTQCDDTSITCAAAPAPAPAPVPTTPVVDLGTASNYVILAKSGISTVPASSITGDIGVSPIAATAITGFSLTADASGEFATSSQLSLTGKAYAASYAAPVPALLTVAVLDMQNAYTDASSRTTENTGVGGGTIGGTTFSPGVYKWTTPLTVKSDLTLSGGPDDVFIFHTTGTMTFATDVTIILNGGVQAKNIFWVAAMTVAAQARAHVEGIILTYTDVTFVTGASLKGRIFAQTAVNLQMATITEPDDHTLSNP